MPYTRDEKRLLRKIGAQIRACREAKGWSQEELAYQADLHRNYIGGIERGERNVAVLNLVKLAKALGVKADTFLRTI